MTRPIKREDLRKVNPFFLIVLPLAIPVALFHFVSGRVGNGIIATVAILAGAVMVALRVREDDQPAEPVGVEQSGGLDGWDGGGSVWLDGPATQPLPGPFQAVWEEIMLAEPLRDEPEPEPLPRREDRPSPAEPAR
jgi:hypothetical protein